MVLLQTCQPHPHQTNEAAVDKKKLPRKLEKEESQSKSEVAAAGGENSSNSGKNSNCSNFPNLKNVTFFYCL